MQQECSQNQDEATHQATPHTPPNMALGGRLLCQGDPPATKRRVNGRSVRPGWFGLIGPDGQLRAALSSGVRPAKRGDRT